jgi:hypothetical protein
MLSAILPLCIFLVCASVGVVQATITPRIVYGDAIGEVTSNYSSLVDLLMLVALLAILDIFIRVLGPFIQPDK